MATKNQNNRNMFDVQKQMQGIQEELPQTRLGLTMGRVLMAGPLGFLVACGALYQAEQAVAQPQQLSRQPLEKDQKRQPRGKEKPVQPAHSFKKPAPTVDLTQEVAFNIALELVQRHMN